MLSSRKQRHAGRQRVSTLGAMRDRVGQQKKGDNKTTLCPLVWWSGMESARKR
jgi:hypothetical protein